MDFKIVKWDHKVAEGIYSISNRVKRYSQIKKIAIRMVEWLNSNNGKFPYPHETAYAVSHCQVEANPFNFFVVNKDLIGKTKTKKGRNTFKNFFFPSQIIVNAKILEAPESIKANKPIRKVIKENGKVSTKIEIKEVMEKNAIFVPEACMSFKHRTSKNKERFYRIKVKYYYPVSILGIKFLIKKVEWVDGLKSHIFQHEVDHSNGKNMYYEKKEITKK